MNIGGTDFGREWPFLVLLVSKLALNVRLLGLEEQLLPNKNPSETTVSMAAIFKGAFKEASLFLYLQSTFSAKQQ